MTLPRIAATLLLAIAAALAPASQADRLAAAQGALDRARAAEASADHAAAFGAYEAAAAELEALLEENPGLQDADRRMALCNVHFRAGATAARAKHPDDAFRALNACADAGMITAWFYQNEADLAPLRRDARWQALAKSLADRNAAIDARHAPGRILFPAGNPAPAAAIVALHGGNGSVEQFAPPWQAIADQTGRAIILVRASQHFGNGQFGWNNKDFRADEDRILEWVERAKREHPGLDDSRIILVGYSQGGGLAMALSAHGRRPWQGTVTLGAYVPIAFRARLADDPPAHPLRLYAIRGDLDESGIEQSHQWLLHAPARQPAPALKEVVLPNEGHELREGYWKAFAEGVEWVGGKAEAR